MDQGYIDILKTIVQEQGKEIFNEISKSKALLTDYTKSEFKKENRIFLQVLDAKIPKIIEKEQDINISFKKSVSLLIEDYGIGEVIAEDIVSTLICVLKGISIQNNEETKQVKIKNQSKIKKTSEEKILSNKKINKETNIGSIITFGNIDWIVLDIQNDRALILSKDIIENRPYNKEKTVTWETSDIRKYLNSKFYKNFTEEEQQIIVETLLDNKSKDKNRKGGNKTNDKIFLLSIEETIKYFVNDSNRVAMFKNEKDWWWMRSPAGNNNYFAVVSDKGDVTGNYFQKFNSGVRPALWIKI